MNTALLVIDVQNALIKEGPYYFEGFVSNIKRLIVAARANNIEVIYIQHEEAGSELERGSDGWKIYEEIGRMPKASICGKL